MIVLSPRSFQSSRLLLLLVITVWTMSACSGFNDTVSGQTMYAPETDNPLTISDDDTNSVVDDPVTASPVVPDPLNPINVSVTFDITVPAYQSDALKVSVTWGDITLNAQWVGDEYWSATGEFPSETEHTLTVTFYDRNGDIELAAFNQALGIHSNATQSVQISAEQFNSDQFDSDGDGTTNFDEMIAGTDPFVDEDSLLEIKDFLNLGYESRMSVSSTFEARLSEERPFYETYEPVEGYPGSVFGTVDIDEDGNGTLSYGDYLYSNRLDLNGTRTHIGNAITWEGYRKAYDGDYNHYVTFTNTVTVVDDTTRSFIEQIEGSNTGTYYYYWDINSDLTGKLIEGTNLCEPVAGTVSMVNSTYPGPYITTTTISKSIDAPYWRVTRTSSDSETTEHFVRELGIYYSASDENRKYFICDFVDI